MNGEELTTVKYYYQSVGFYFPSETINGTTFNEFSTFDETAMIVEIFKRYGYPNEENSIEIEFGEESGTIEYPFVDTALTYKKKNGETGEITVKYFKRGGYDSAFLNLTGHEVITLNENGNKDVYDFIYQYDDTISYYYGFEINGITYDCPYHLEDFVTYQQVSLKKLANIHAKWCTELNSFVLLSEGTYNEITTTDQIEFGRALIKRYDYPNGRTTKITSYLNKGESTEVRYEFKIDDIYIKCGISYYDRSETNQNEFTDRFAIYYDAEKNKYIYAYNVTDSDEYYRYEGTCTCNEWEFVDKFHDIYPYAAWDPLHDYGLYLINGHRIGVKISDDDIRLYTYYDDVTEVQAFYYDNDNNKQTATVYVPKTRYDLFFVPDESDKTLYIYSDTTYTEENGFYSEKYLYDILVQKYKCSVNKFREIGYKNKTHPPLVPLKFSYYPGSAKESNRVYYNKTAKNYVVTSSTKELSGTMDIYIDVFGYPKFNTLFQVYDNDDNLYDSLAVEKFTAYLVDLSFTLSDGTAGYKQKYVFDMETCKISTSFTNIDYKDYIYLVLAGQGYSIDADKEINILWSYNGRHLCKVLAENGTTNYYIEYTIQYTTTEGSYTEETLYIPSSKIELSSLGETTNNKIAESNNVVTVKLQPINKILYYGRYNGDSTRYLAKATITGDTTRVQYYDYYKDSGKIYMSENGYQIGEMTIYYFRNLKKDGILEKNDKHLLLEINDFISASYDLTN